MTGLEYAVEAAGSKAGLGKMLGLSRQAVAKWTTVPTEYLLRIERETGIPRHLLRPDIFKGYKRDARC